MAGWFKFAIVLALLIICLTACAGPGAKGQSNPDYEEQESNVEPVREPSPVSISEDEIDSDLLFHALAAERLGAAGDYERALEHALEAARIADRPDFARQASMLAVQLENWSALGEAAGRWLELAPADAAARQMLILSLINRSFHDRAADQLIELIGQADDLASGWQDAVGLLASAADPEEALLLMEIMAERGSLQRAQWLRYQSLLYWHLERADEALTTALVAAQTEPSAENLIWAARLSMLADNYQQALGLYRSARTDNPDASELILAEADLLNRMDQTDQAIDLLADSPPTISGLYALAVYLYEQDRHAEAAEALERLSQASPESDSERAEHAFLVGFLSELLGQNERAMRWYAKVPDGVNLHRAQLRRAALMSAEGRLDSARELLAEVRQSGDPGLEEQSWIVEADLLGRSDQASEAVDLLSGVLRERPESIALLYSRALWAIETDNLDLAEQDLRRIIQIDADNAMAINALGYTLADHTNRYREAERLIERALELTPNDPAVLDSMGWVYFRLGRLEQSLPYLEQAYGMDKNPEIGAHLAEVLWHLERSAESRELLEQLLEQFPDDPTLLETHKRLESIGQ